MHIPKHTMAGYAIFYQHCSAHKRGLFFVEGSRSELTNRVALRRLSLHAQKNGVAHRAFNLMCLNFLQVKQD